MSEKDMLVSWLNEFKGKGTRNVYKSILRKFRRFIGMDLNEYLSQDRDFLGDFKGFAASLDSPPKTVLLYTSVVKLFLEEQKALKLSENEWRKIRKRQEIVSISVTQDRAPTKSELRRILNYLDVKGRALVLFLESTGARIGETLQIKTKDMDLDSDPPKATIRALTTKGIKGGRTVRMSYEARDAIRDWMKVKDSLRKKSGKRFDTSRVFPFTPDNARIMWDGAIVKAGLDQKDPETKRHILHFHSLRKFFRTNIGLDFDLTNALMGHYAYLDKSYRRLKEDDIDRAYLSAMKNVSIYSAPTSRKEEVLRALRMQGLTIEDVRKVILSEMHEAGEGTGGGMSLKVPVDEDYVVSMEDEEIGKYALKALREKLLGTTETRQKVVSEDKLEEYLEKGWKYVNSLNNGSGKCIVSKN